LLLWGILGELLFTAGVVYWPPAQEVFGTAALPGWVLLLLFGFPVLVWAADEAVRAVYRRSGDGPRLPRPRGAVPAEPAVP
jgi:hypothetical protein